jgi:hypothetical protein
VQFRSTLVLRHIVNYKDKYIQYIIIHILLKLYSFQELYLISCGYPHLHENFDMLEIMSKSPRRKLSNLFYLKINK